MSLLGFGFAIFFGLAILFAVCFFDLRSKYAKLNLQLEQAEADFQNRANELYQAGAQSGREEINRMVVELYGKQELLQQANEGLTKLIGDLSLEKEQLVNSIPTLIEKERGKAVESSRVVLKGKISEQLAPFMPNFAYKSSDLRFLGSPVDFLCLNGMSDGKIKEIILLDVKTGDAQLTERQKQIQKAFENCNVRFEIFRM